MWEWNAIGMCRLEFRTGCSNGDNSYLIGAELSFRFELEHTGKVSIMSIASNSVRKEISKKSPSKELSEDAKNAISVIKGLIKTRKQITTVKDIEREYLEMEGQKIPFKKLGFNSLDQLMRASGDFHLSNNNGEVSWSNITTLSTVG